MTTVVLDRGMERRLQASRAASGLDRHDEVWEGVYMMTPAPNNEHQDIATELCAIFWATLGGREMARIFAGVNVGDREQGWQENYRCPDVAVFLAGTRAKDCGTHWCGGPDFAVEVVSPNDRARDKLGFYSSVNVRELLIIDRRPWRLELYRLDDGQLRLFGTSTTRQPAVLASRVMPLSFSLQAARPRPKILIRTARGRKQWSV